MRHRLALVVIVLAVTIGAPAPVAAVTVVCTINNGAVNGSDSLGGQYPGVDNPNNDTGQYSVNNYTHDLTLYESCDPTADWFKDSHLVWSQTAVNKLRAEATTRTLQVEQHVLPQGAYNYDDGQASNLPWSYFYIAPINEQNNDGYEDVAFGIYQPDRIVAYGDYHAYLRWNQEQDGGFLNGSPFLNFVETNVTYGDKNFKLINYDTIGRMYKRVYNNK
jgi:hypothetical protein